VYLLVDGPDTLAANLSDISIVIRSVYPMHLVRLLSADALDGFEFLVEGIWFIY